MELVREYLGSHIGVSGPQYSVLVAIAHLQGGSGTSVSAVAEALHVSSAFVASETGKLARRRLVDKRSSTDDRRVVLLSISAAGRTTLGRIGTQIRTINDLFFGALDAKAFTALGTSVASLVTSSRQAIQFINSGGRDPQIALEAAE
jgi:DNA-binding MarR family transcriptional regulator